MEGDWSALLRPPSQRLLHALLPGPRTLTELAHDLGVTKPAIQRPLKELERLGVVRRDYRPREGTRDVVYTAVGCSLRLDILPGGLALAWASPGAGDAHFPLVGQVREPRDRAEVLTLLRRLEAALPDAWSGLFLVLFGSMARGESTRKSDIDLMVVLPRKDRDLQERVASAIAECQSEVEHAIQPFFTTKASFLAGEKRMDAVAAREGMVIHGAASERDLWSMMTRYRTISI